MDERKLPNAEEFKCMPINAGGSYCATAAEAVSTSHSSQTFLALLLTDSLTLFFAKQVSRAPPFCPTRRGSLSLTHALDEPSSLCNCIRSQENKGTYSCQHSCTVCSIYLFLQHVSSTDDRLQAKIL